MILVTQIKYLVGTLTRTSNSVTWSRSFRDEIPNLLAHIFAIWTLQNTKHYNTMRGIEAARCLFIDATCWSGYCYFSSARYWLRELQRNHGT